MLAATRRKYAEMARIPPIPPFATPVKHLKFEASIWFERWRIASTKGIPMPKMKTHKGTKKRFRLTASGKAKHRKAGTSHLAFRISNKRRRNLRGTGVLAKPMEQRIAIALNGYSN